jgi:hypothetical protein
MQPRVPYVARQILTKAVIERALFSGDSGYRFHKSPLGKVT